MDTLKGLLRSCRDREGIAVDAPHRVTPYSYDEFGTNGWKAGNLFRHYGVRAGASMAVVVGPNDPGEGSTVGLPDAPQPLLALLGGVSLGATVSLTPATPVDGRGLVLPAGWLDRYPVEPSCSQIAYGGPPEDPSVVHFEAESWSENPMEPPDTVSAGDDAVTIDGETYTHETLVAATRDVVDEYGIDEGDEVALGASLTEPGALVAGLLAPLSTGATILVPDADGTVDESAASLVVGDAASDVPTADVTATLRDIHRA